MQITLRAARANRDLSLERAAELIQKELDESGVQTKRVTRYTVRNWEKGITIPNIFHIKAIEKVYGVTYNDLIFCQQNTVKQ